MMLENCLLVSLLRAVIIGCTFIVINSLQQECHFSVPLAGPEIYYVQRDDTCSIIVDWSDDIMISTDRDRCEADDVSGYEVEVNFMSSCINQSLPQTVLTGTIYNFSTFLSDINVDSECSETSNCYRHRAKIRAQLRDSSWSHYSTWTTVSNAYRTVGVCVRKGTAELCLPVQGCGEPGFPIFASNQSQELHHLGDNTTHLRIEARRICFKNVTASIHYVEFCHKQSIDCHNQNTNMDEISLRSSTIIEVKTGHCDTCTPSMLNSSNSVLYSISHCAIDSEIFGSRGFLQDTCFTLMQDDIPPITINYVQYTNKLLSDSDILCRDNHNITFDDGRYEILDLPHTPCDEISTIPSSTETQSSIHNNDIVIIPWPVIVTSSALLSCLNLL